MWQTFWVIVLSGLLFMHNASAAKNRIAVKAPAKRRYLTLLSFDGGGLRLRMTNQMLVELEKQIKLYYIDHPDLLPEDAGPVTSPDDLEVHLADYFSCIAGVSAGSWVAVYYASKGGNGAVSQLLSDPHVIHKYGDFYPGSAEGLNVFFEEYGKKIYPPPVCNLRFFPRFRPRIWGPPVDFPIFTSPLYRANGLEEALEAIYGETKLSELHTSAIIHAYDIDRGEPVLFTHNMKNESLRSAASRVKAAGAVIFRGTSEEPEKEEGVAGYLRYLDSMPHDFLIRDIARASSAFPAVHGAKTFNAVNDPNSQFKCVDGALAAANPTLHALNFMLRIHGIAALHNISVLSLGSGAVTGDNAMNVGDDGFSWLTSGALSTIIQDGGSLSLVSNLNYLLYEQLNFTPGQFVRLQVLADVNSRYRQTLSRFSFVEELDNLKKVGESVAVSYQSDLKNFVENFIFQTSEMDTEKPPT